MFFIIVLFIFVIFILINVYVSFMLVLGILGSFSIKSPLFIFWIILLIYISVLVLEMLIF